MSDVSDFYTPGNFGLEKFDKQVVTPHYTFPDSYVQRLSDMTTGVTQSWSRVELCREPFRPREVARRQQWT